MHILPLHEKHAIESVTFGVEWQQPLPPNVMATLETVYEATLKDQLPSKKPLHHLAFKFDLAGAGGSEIQPPAACGWVFERFEPNGQVSHRMQLLTNSLVVTSLIYDRWKSAFDIAMDYMRPFLPLISFSADGVTAFVLEYVDTFNIVRDQGEKFRPEFALRRESKRLPAIIFDQESLWHAHHGYFTDSEEGHARRLLTTANTDFLDENGALKLRILTTHRTIFTPSLSTPNLLDSENALMNKEMEIMHIENKSVMRDLLNDEILNKIGMRTLDDEQAI